MRPGGTPFPRALLIVASLAGTLACNDGSVARPSRTYRMGFSELGPSATDTALAVQSVMMWSTRADAGITHIGVPWRLLLDGFTPETLVTVIVRPLIAFYRSRGFQVVITLDVTNGLARDQEAPDLVQRGRSITEPAIQQLYRSYVDAIDTIIRPDYLGLAAETNLIRFAAPAPVYAAVVQMTNDAATALRARHTTSLLYVSEQVETAWGRLGGGGSYVGIHQDLVDFPFMDVVGLSSYPYLGGFADPSDVPLDYYSRIGDESGKRVMVVEGGWASASLPGLPSSPQEEARWISHEAQLLERARALFLFQLEFADIDTTTIPPPLPPNIGLFTTLGMVDSQLRPKPALATWDSLFALPRVP